MRALKNFRQLNQGRICGKIRVFSALSNAEDLCILRPCLFILLIVLQATTLLISTWFSSNLAYLSVPSYTLTEPWLQLCKNYYQEIVWLTHRYQVVH